VKYKRQNLRKGKVTTESADVSDVGWEKKKQVEKKWEDGGERLIEKRG